MQTKPLTPDTQRVVDDLRALKSSAERLYGPCPTCTVLGHAISRLSYLDVDRERLSAWLQDERRSLDQLRAEHATCAQSANRRRRRRGVRSDTGETLTQPDTSSTAAERSKEPRS